MKNLLDYQAVIADLDGTLYYQKPVRRAMGKEMLLHFWHMADFFTVFRYRRLYEKGYQEKQRLDRLSPRAPKVIREWMIERPLKHIAKNRDAELIALLSSLQKKNVPVIVYSDYPFAEKLCALGFAPSQAYCSDDLGCLKPDASGLMRILRSQGIAPEKCLVIGDRREKDGALAADMNSESIILSPEKHERLGTYERLEQIDGYKEQAEE